VVRRKYDEKAKVGKKKMDRTEKKDAQYSPPGLRGMIKIKK